MKAYNLKYKNLERLELFLKKNNIKDSSKVLVQVFAGIPEEKYINNIITNLIKILPLANIIGTTTDGEIINKEITVEETIISITVFEKTEVEIIKTSGNKSSFQMGKNLIKEIKQQQDEPKVLILFADGLHINGESVLTAFNKFLPNLIVSGGMAGDNAIFKETFVFTKEGIVEEGIVGATLSGKDLQVGTSSSFGWQEIGKEMTITKSIENKVIEIDGISPTEIYTKYLGETIGNNLPSTGIEFPLILNRNGGKIARAVVAKKKGGSLIFAGNINDGDKIRLGYGNVEEILENKKTLYKEIEQKPIETIFIYSCMARKKLLGKNILTEISPLTDISEVSGFFTYGEFFNENKTNQLLNETMTVLLLSENTKVNKKKLHKMEEQDNENKTILALSHLVSQTTKELEELNQGLEDKVKYEIEKNRKQEIQILEQAKNAALGEMIGNIAHQWRQPLSSISVGASGLLVMSELGVLEEEETKEGLERIVEQSQYLSETIETFRDFLKSDKEKTNVDIENSINSAIGVVGTVINDYHIELEYKKNILKEPIQIYVKKGELQQVIINLINNAKDILLEKNISKPKIKVNLELVKNDVIISVEDNGGGVPEDIITKIFDPYFTTKHKSKGTGLGLHMSYRIIVESFGGDLYVKNTDSGAKFYIRLPLSLRVKK